MPYYNDVPYYYGVSYANHSSLMTGTGRPFTSLSRFSPHLSTISESPLNHLHRFSPIVRHPRRVIDTADIDVSSPRILSHDGNRPRNRLRRDRPTIKIRSQALKHNPALREHNERHEKSVGELLMEKFLIKDKKSSSDGQQQPVRLYHQVSLESDESAQEHETLQKRITRRFTRRRSSDLQLDPEQLQREATYAQVQAKVLDSLVAEEQAQIESEARRGTLIRKGTVRGPMNGYSYYSSHSADSDTMTREEEEEAALRMRKTMKKTKRKKKSADKPSPPDKAVANDHVSDNRRSSTSSEMSVDSKIEEEEGLLGENGPRPQMYKIEACNSAGDFSTIWVNASENEPRHKLNAEQFRENVRVPIPKKSGADATTAAKNADETETLVVLPVKKQYVKDLSRNSVYLTMKKPVEKLHDEKLDEKLGERLETDAEEIDEDKRLANDFVDARILENDVSKSSVCDEESKLNSEMQADNIKDVVFKKSTGKFKSLEESLTKKEDHAILKSLGDDSCVKRDAVVSKTKDDKVREVVTKAESPKNIETTNASSSSVESAVTTIDSTSEQTKQLESPKDTLDMKAKKDNENQKNEIAKKNLETTTTTKTSKTLVSKDVPSATTKKDNEIQKNESAIGVSKKNLEATATVRTSKTLVSSKDALSAATKKDNEDQKNESAIGAVKKNLGATTTVKTLEALTSSKDTLSITTKEDNENQKNEDAIDTTKKNLEAITAVKTAEALTLSKDALSATMKKDHENQKEQSAIDVTKKNLEAVPTAKTKISEALASSKVPSTKKDNEKNESAIDISKKNLETIPTTKTKTPEVPVSPKNASFPKKDNEGRKNEIAIGGTSKKSLEAAIKPKIPEAASRMDKFAEEEARDASDAPKIPAMSHEDVSATTTARRSVATNAGDTRENSASIATIPTPSAAGLPKVSKINADRNNAVEAPESSLREAAVYLASESPVNKSERRVAEVDAVGVATLPGKKPDKASNLAKKSASALDASPKKANGVSEAGELACERRDDAAKSKSDETTLLEGANSEVRSNERNEITRAGDVKSTRDTGLTKTPRSETGVASRELLPEAISSSAPATRSETEAAVLETSTNASKEAKSFKIDVKKISAVVDAEKDSSRDSGVSSPKGKVSKLGGVESKFPFKVKTLQKTSEIGKDSSALKATKNDDGKTPTAAKRDANVPRILKKSISVDPPKSTSDFSPSNANVPSKTLHQSMSVDEKAADKSMPVKKLLEPTKFPNKVTEKKPTTSLDVSCEKSQTEPTGQLSKSASTESIDFWSEIKTPDSPRATRLNKEQSAAPLGDANAVSPKTEVKADPISGPKWVSSEPATRGKPTTAAIKELDEKKNETDVKISVAPDATAAVAFNDVVEERRTKERAVIPPVESPRPKAEVEKSAQQQTKAPRAKKKNSNLSIAIGKDSSSTVKKAPTKREDTATSTPSRPEPDATPIPSDAATPNTSSEESTPVVVPEITVPVINIVEAPKLPRSDGQSVDHEDYEDVSTPTNELPDPALTKISKWSNRDDLTNADDAQTPVASEEASLAASPAASPQSSKTKRAVKKKKPSSKKPSAKGDKETSKKASNESITAKKAGNEPTTTSQQNTLGVKLQQANKQLLSKPSPKGSPRNSPRNSPSQRPMDLIKMFYTTPSALLTATPRDLSKVRRVKIKRRRHHSIPRTPSVSSDSTGSTTSTATTESTDGSGSTCTELDDDVEQKRMNSTRSNDSGFDGSPRISNCDMACHKKCEKLTGNLCGLNQKLVAEALQALKRAPSQSSDNQRNSDSSDHFSSGRITPPATNLPRFKKYAVTDFNFLKVLGKGSFGKVLLAELRGTECVYAVKCLKKDVVLEDDDVECTLIERKVLTLATRHPYLCHLFCTFQTDSHLFFVMEYLNGGDLMFHIQKSGRFPEARARFYAAEIWSGLNFLHKKGIVYRDLKLDNVLLDFDGHIRIADFGMCKLQIFLDRTADTFCGTPDYMAPEIIKGLKYNQAVDWWSYGVLLYEMLTGQSPFSGCDEDELFWSICNERPFIPRYLSQEATDILVCLLEKDSGKRPPGHEIAMHAFFQHLPWDRLERRQLEAPFKPALDHTLDTKYFDTAFTTERPRLTPVPEQILTSMDQGVFRGFSYTNPNATD